MRITVAGGAFHEDVGCGEGIAARRGQALDSAKKSAVTDAEKRCLRHWGNQFGLCLYDPQKRGVTAANGTAVADE